MKCKYCGFDDSKVIDSRLSEDGCSVRRRRECLKCGKRFNTFEEYETIPVLVIKSNGDRQPFDKEKIRKGIVKSCEKRPVTFAQIEEMVNEIEREVYNTLEPEIKSSKIGELVMQHLKQVDEVAYIRFASVYRQFKDVGNFIELLEDFKKDLEKK
ncbi:MAG: transcriptional repressor NrdR [Clostridia bacterium]|nr:transcriptional repressor NrdR [Clostridia bacterium]